MESSRRSASHSRHGMVAASHPVAVRIGVDLLRRGGSAVDAAIGANAALGFLEPTACGIGGDLFAIVWNAADGRLHAVDGSGRAPRALTAERVRPDDDGTIPLFSPFSWTVPGASTHGSSCTTRSAACRWPTSWPRPSNPPRRASRSRGSSRPSGRRRRPRSATSRGSLRRFFQEASHRAKVNRFATRVWRRPTGYWPRTDGTPSTAVRSRGRWSRFRRSTEASSSSRTWQTTARTASRRSPPRTATSRCSSFRRPARDSRRCRF